MIIHTFGAYFGLGVSLMLYKAKDNSCKSAVYHSDLFAMIGTAALLFALW